MMNLFAIFKRNRKEQEFGDYTKSSKRQIYEQIAQKLNSNPQYVYEIAHGCPLMDYDDRVIHQALIDAGILKRRD